jgi:hypothetical protein
MRKFGLTVVAMFGLLGMSVSSVHAVLANTNAMIVKFAFTANIQGPILSVTNPPTTNSTYKVIKVKVASQDVLNMLQAEYGVTFPIGAQLGLTASFDFVVLDKSGNIFKNVSTNLSDSSYAFYITNNSNPVIIGKASQNATTLSLAVTELQPDWGVYYSDGNGNNFHFTGLLTIKAVASQTGSLAIFKNISLTLPGSGAGTFFNPNDGLYDDAVFTGTWGCVGVGLTN